MDKKTYLRTLNGEIQKLNGLIDYKIIHNHDYRSEARRHKRLLNQIRKEETGRLVGKMFQVLLPKWR